MRQTKEVTAPTGAAAAVYIRCSTKTQSLELQQREVYEWCGRHFMPIYATYEDFGVSAHRRPSRRPSFERMMEDARAGYFQVVAVYKLCRFGRSLPDVIHNILELDGLGIRFVAITQGIDTSDRSPVSKMLLHMLSAFAQFEADIIQERVLDGMENARRFGTRSGNAIGRPRAVFDRDKAAELRSQGLSYPQIAERLKVGTGTVYRELEKQYIRDAMK